jgi:hypothetical protein
LLHLFTYLQSAALSLFLLGLAGVALLSDASSLSVPGVPWWTGRQLAWWLLAGGLFGIGSVVLAAKGKWPILLFLWTLVVLGVIVYGFYYSPHTFDGMEDFRSTLNLTIAQLVAVAGGLSKALQRQPRP